MRHSLAFLVLFASCSGPAKHTAVVAQVANDAGLTTQVEGGPPAPPTFRLPGDVAPTHYALDLAIDPTSDAFVGKIDIVLDVKQATSVVWLNATDLTIDGAAFFVDGKARTAQVLPGNDDFVAFATEPALTPGQVVQLHIQWHGAIDKVRSRGIYRQNEGDDWYVYTFFEPTDARRAFPCFDEPNYKVPWALTIHAKQKLVVAANAPVASSKDETDGTQTVSFAETPPLPSYLVAFVVGPFDVIDGGTAGNYATPFRIIVPKGRGAETAWAKESTPKLVGQLESYFGMPYPYKKLDVAVVPRYWGTMEHPGIVALGQPLSLIKPSEATIERKELYADIAVHELAHYWFGDYVTCAWWNDTWLNEALGEWMDGKMADQFEPAWHFQLDRLAEIEAAMADDSLATAQKIRLPVNSKHDIENSFSGSITYAKGNAVMSMFEAWVGERAWQGGIRDYMAKHAWGNATLDDFLAAIAGYAGKEGVPEAMKTFLDQPGVPLVSVSLACDKGATPALHLAQKRYLPLGSKGSDDALWHIPVCVRWSSGMTPMCTLLTAKAADVPLEHETKCPAWIDANADARGYYRVHYEGDLAKKIAAAAKKELTVRERMALVSDTGALIDAGEISVADGLALVPSLASDPERHIFYGAFSFLRYVRRDTLDPKLLPNFARFVAKTFGPRAKTLGWKAKAGEADDVRKLRPTLMSMVAIGGEDAKLQAEAKKLALAWLADHEAVDPDMAGVVLSIAARHGDRAFFDRLLDAAKAAKDREERARLVGALGDFEDPDIAKAALDLVLAGTFDLRESSAIVGGVFGDVKTRDLAYAWLEDHFDQMTAMMRDDEIMWTIGGIAGSFCDQTHRDDAAAFFAPRAKQHDGAEKALENALEADDLCIASWKRAEPDVNAFLKKY